MRFDIGVTLAQDVHDQVPALLTATTRIHNLDASSRWLHVLPMPWLDWTNWVHGIPERGPDDFYPQWLRESGRMVEYWTDESAIGLLETRQSLAIWWDQLVAWMVAGDETGLSADATAAEIEQQALAMRELGLMFHYLGTYNAWLGRYLYWTRVDAARGA